MKKLHIALISVLTLTLIAIPATSTYAQTRSADDADIQRRLEDEGLDQAPEVIEVDEIEWRGEAPSSGFVDSDGNPLSDEEYEEYQEENSKGIFRKHPWILPLVIVAIAGSVLVVRKKRK